MATRGQIKQRKKKGEMTLFKEEPKRTTRKTRRGQRSTVTEAAPSAGGSRTSRKSMRDKQAEKRAAEKAAEAAKPKVTGGRGRVAGKKGIGAKLPAKPKVQKKAPGADAVAGLGAANIALNKQKAKPKKKMKLFGVEIKPASKRTGSSRKMSKRKFAGGGMASKMSAKGGARGGKKMMMPGGMKDGGLVMTMVDGRKVPAFAADGKGANDLAKKKNGGMMKSKMASKGGAKGGRMPGGMKNGGMAKKGYSKGGAVRGKPRGVGAALRGYGKALK